MRYPFRFLILFIILLIIIQNSSHGQVQSDDRVRETIVSVKDSVTVPIRPDESLQERGNLIPIRTKFQFSLENLARGLLGMGVLIFISFLISENRKAIPWKVVTAGLLLQVILAIGI
jgi:hypothetical protein